jgi:large subunit ribosomal protein L17
MRHQRTGKKLGRDSAHRRALYANLTSELIEHERIKTTITKAKAVKPLAEQMITLGRRGDIHARRQAVAVLRSKDIVHKLFSDLGPRFAERPGGYLRIVRLGPRQGDAAEMVYLELVDTPLVFKSKLEDAEGPVPGLPGGERFQPQAPEPEAPVRDSGPGEGDSGEPGASPADSGETEGEGEKPEAEVEGDEPEASAEVAEAEPEAAEEAEEPEAKEPAAEAEVAEEAEPEAAAEPDAEAEAPADES